MKIWNGKTGWVCLAGSFAIFTKNQEEIIDGGDTFRHYHSFYQIGVLA